MRPLREDPERVERADRVLRALREEGVRPEGLLPVREDGLCAGKDGAGAAPCAARPQTSQ